MNGWRKLIGGLDFLVPVALRWSLMALAVWLGAALVRNTTDTLRDLTGRTPAVYIVQADRPMR